MEMKKGINVCMFSYYFPPHYSGSAIQAVNLAHEMNKRGINAFFCTVNRGGAGQTDNFEGFRVYRINEGKGNYGELVLWKNLLQLLRSKQEECDIIHSHGAYLRNSIVGPIARILGKKSLVKISLSENDLFGMDKGKSGWLHRKFMSQIDRYVSISRKITRELTDYEFPAKKIREIPNGVDTKRFYPVSDDDRIILRDRHGLPADSKICLYVGVIDERKNVKWLIDEWKTIDENHSGHLLIVGPVSRDDKSAVFYNSLKAQESLFQGRLRFINYTDSIEDMYRLADIFILPSTNEGMPNVVLEAMASGLPCLVSSTSGTEDLINGNNGILFNTAQRVSFHQGMEKLHNRGVRLSTGAKARESVEARYSIGHVADTYMELYEEMLLGRDA